MSIHLAGRLIRATATPTRDGMLLRVNLHDWDESKTRERELVNLTIDGIDQGYRVRSVLRCPGGEPEAWVWLVESQAELAEFPFDEPEPVRAFGCGRIGGGGNG
jgi:hypothetical protein